MKTKTIKKKGEIMAFQYERALNGGEIRTVDGKKYVFNTRKRMLKWLEINLA